MRPLGPMMRSVGRSVGPRYRPTLGLHSINPQTELLGSSETPPSSSSGVGAHGGVLTHSRVLTSCGTTDTNVIRPCLNGSHFRAPPTRSVFGNLYTRVCTHSFFPLPSPHLHGTGPQCRYWPPWPPWQNCDSLWPPGARCFSLAACLPTSLLTSDLDPRESPSQCHANLLGWLPSSYPCLNRSPNNSIHYVGAGFLETGRKRKLSEPSESFFFKLTMGHLSPPQRGKLHCLRVF